MFEQTRPKGERLCFDSGAQPREVLHAIVGSGARLIVAGVVIGIGVSVALRRVVSTQIVNVPLADPAAVLALVLFALVGLAACVVPGVRATRLDPVRALHLE